MESLGFIAHYGFTPSINVFNDSKIKLEEDKSELNLLISECGDIRHIMKSLSDVLPIKEKRQ